MYWPKLKVELINAKMAAEVPRRLIRPNLAAFQ